MEATSKDLAMSGQAPVSGSSSRISARIPFHHATNCHALTMHGRNVTLHVISVLLRKHNDEHCRFRCHRQSSARLVIQDRSSKVKASKCQCQCQCQCQCDHHSPRVVQSRKRITRLPTSWAGWGLFPSTFAELSEMPFRQTMRPVARNYKIGHISVNKSANLSLKEL